MHRVLIVDDEPFIIEGLYYIIDWAGLGLTIVGHAANGEAALQQLAAQQVDILITDISMPVMGGLELIRRAREAYPSLKIVVLSGYDEFDYLKQAMRSGIENYLLKPVNVEELRSTMASTVDKLRTSVSDRWTDEDVDILRHAIVYRWLTGAISPRELKERATALELPILARHYLAALIRSSQPSESDYRAARACVHHPQTLVLPNLTGETIVLYAAEEPEDMKALALAQLKPLLTELEGPVYLALGTVVEGARAAQVTYEQALDAVQYRLLHPGGGVLDYEALHQQEGEGEADMPAWEVYARLIAMRDKLQLDEQIAADIQRLLTQPGMTPSGLRHAAVELIVRFKTELQQLRSLEEPELYREELQQAAASASVIELTQVVQRVAGQTIDALAKSVKSPVVEQVLARIAADYRQSLSLKTLGQEYKVHPVYLGQLFHKEMGESFTEYLNRYRIDQAKQLLRNSNSKVQEIAREVGYWETGYFYKQFKKHVGVSPMDYRELT
ncbi:DNA-binding response regulator [Paenibacillus sp. 598K]|uniref:response regulator transcription factor n=1 Tax=Paenibacillus sp. 598K TaxID=1117987 RepID=UPI000FFA864E|nr:response regulator transcription factor [Paenibacillus sp. 598K]GBF77290.1 DNA-binding response regulator [Paenibacillus sp. 598K]